MEYQGYNRRPLKYYNDYSHGFFKDYQLFDYHGFIRESVKDY